MKKKESPLRQTHNSFKQISNPLLPLLAVLLLGLMASCHHTATLTPAQLAYYSDSLLRLERAAHANPHEGLRQIELLRQEGKAPAYKVDWVTANIHQMLNQHLLCIHYFKQAFSNDSVQANYQPYINLCSNLADEYIRTAQYDSALHYVHLIMDKSAQLDDPDRGNQIVYKYLTNIYFATGDVPSGIRATRTAIQLTWKKHEHRISSGEGYLSRTLYDLANLYSTLAEHAPLPVATQSLDTLNNVIDQLSGLLLTPERPDGIPQSVLDALRATARIQHCRILQAQGHTAEALAQAQRLEQSITGQSDTQARRLLIHLYADLNAYAPAIRLLEQQLQLDNRTDSFGIATHDTYRLLGEALHATGRSAQAWQYIQRAALITDTLNLRRSRSEAMQTAALYENEEKAHRIAIQNAAIQHQRIAISTLGLVALLLAVILYLGRRILNDTRRRNRTMTQLIHEEHLNNQVMQKRITHLMKALIRRPLPMPSIVTATPPADKDNAAAAPEPSTTAMAADTPLPEPSNTSRRNFTRHSPELFARLEKVLKEDGLFRQPVKREQLTELLQTNKDVLNDTVWEYTGMSLLNYVQSLRLDCAISLLENTASSIEEIAQEAGFTSIRILQRVFREKYDMSPAEYRKLYKAQKI